jgi:HAE1 family hydrophobic/amphiphilic exporter-1
LIDWIVRRPVGVFAFYALAVLLALAAAFRLPVALLPSLHFPALMVYTAYPDIAPDEVESSLTERVEEAVAGISGLTGIEGRSQLGGSLVRLDFAWNQDLDLAALEVREKLDRQADAWPPGAQRPLVFRIDPTQRPILILSLRARDPHLPAEETERLARDLVARRLEQLEGVARVRVAGGVEPRLEVLIDSDRAAALGLDLEEVGAALLRANRSLFGGVVRDGPRRFALEIKGELADAGDVRSLLVSGAGAPPVHLGQIAEVRATVANRRGLSRLDGQEVLLLAVEKRADANALATIESSRDTLAALRAELPGIEITTVVDASIYIRSAIRNVLGTLLLGSLLPAAVIGLYIRQPQALLAVVVSLPMSLALSLILFDLLGISLNMISLAGLALGVGMLVDNALVVVENIERLRRLGMDRLEAAIRGTSELAGALTASTLTTVAVFAPLVLVEGLAGRIFRDQALAIVCSVGASLLVALTLVPLLVSRRFSAAADRNEPPPTPGFRESERILRLCLRRGGVAVAATAGLLALGLAVAPRLPRAVVPDAPERQVEIRLEGRSDAELAWLSGRSAQLEQFAAGLPGVTHVLADLGETEAEMLDLEPRLEFQGDLTITLDDRVRPEEVAEALLARAPPAETSAEVKLVQPQIRSLLVASDADLAIDLSRGRREDWRPGQLNAIGDRLAGLPELRNARQVHATRLPARELRIRTGELHRYQIDPATFELYLDAAIGGREATVIRRIDSETPLLLRLAPGDRLSDLLEARAPAQGGALYPLGLFLDIRDKTIPTVLLRRQRQPVERFLADLAPGADLAKASAAIEAALRPLLPADARVELAGAHGAFRAGLRALVISLLLSVLIVYLILAAEFESFGLPLLVLVSVPVAAAGATLALAACGMGWNLMSLTGLVIMVGVSDNDAILKVDSIEAKRREGAAPLRAVLEASRDRFRAIVMTTVTNLFGLLPMCLALGDSGPLQAPMAVALIGGLAASTLFTLWIAPVLYLAIWGRDSRTRRAEP